MKVTNMLRTLLLPLIICSLLVGSILMLVGAAKFFSLDPKQVNRDGLSRQLDIFTDCGAKTAIERPAVQERIREGNRTQQEQATLATDSGGSGSEVVTLQEGDRSGQTPGQSGGGAGQAGEDVSGLLQSRCEMQQRPYKWLLLWTGSAVGLTLLLLVWLIFRAPSGLLQWLAIHVAVTLTLLVVSVFVAMHLLTATRDLTDCTGFNQSAIQEIQRQGFICYGNPTRASAANLLDHWAKIFWVGVGFSFLGMGLLSLLVPLLSWAKSRYRDEGDIEMTDARYRDRSGTGTGRDYQTRSATGFPSSFTGYDRDRSTYGRDYDRDRSSSSWWGTGDRRDQQHDRTGDYDDRSWFERMTGQPRHHEQHDRDWRHGSGTGYSSDATRHHQSHYGAPAATAPSSRYDAYYDPSRSSSSSHYAQQHQQHQPSAPSSGSHVAPGAGGRVTEYEHQGPGIIDRALGRDTHQTTQTTRPVDARGQPYDRGMLGGLTSGLTSDRDRDVRTGAVDRSGVDRTVDRDRDRDVRHSSHAVAGDRSDTHSHATRIPVQ